MSGLTLSPFIDDDAFAMTSLTDGIMLFEPVPQTFAPLFSESLSETRTPMIEFDGMNISLIDPETLGTRGKQQGSTKRKAVTLEIPFYPREAAILPQEFADIRSFGKASVLAKFGEIKQKKLAELRDSHDMTHEYNRSRAMFGEFIDPDGNKHNVWDLLGIKKDIFTFDSNDASANILTQCLYLKRRIEKGLLGDYHTGVRCEMSPEAFDDFLKLPQVKKAFANYSKADQMLAGNGLDISIESGAKPKVIDLVGRNYHRQPVKEVRAFKFGGIEFRENLDYSRDFNGKIIRHIKSHEAVAFPVGTRETFKEQIAPGSFLECNDEPAKKYYVKGERRAFNRGIDITSESSVLPICLRPSVLVPIKVKPVKVKPF